MKELLFRNDGFPHVIYRMIRLDTTDNISDNGAELEDYRPLPRRAGLDVGRTGYLDRVLGFSQTFYRAAEFAPSAATFA